MVKGTPAPLRRLTTHWSISLRAHLIRQAMVADVWSPPRAVARRAGVRFRFGTDVGHRDRVSDGRSDRRLCQAGRLAFSSSAKVSWMPFATSGTASVTPSPPLIPKYRTPL